MSTAWVQAEVSQKRGGNHRINGLLGGCWDDDITSDEMDDDMDHSRKFPTFSTGKSYFWAPKMNK